jgi:glycosyltransferase involved in cell wall biosynthesis
MPKVSVIVPNFNHAEFLGRRLDSILNQHFQDFEVIILDDKSTDQSRQVLEAYRDNPKITGIVLNDTNSGNTFLQWKKGFELAKGEWVWIAESDDWCEPTLLEELLGPLEKDSGIVLGYCQSIYVDAFDKIIWKTQADFIEEIMDGSNFVSGKMMATNAIPNASMVLFRRDAVEKADPGFTKMKYCGDWLFWTSICFSGKVFISGKYLNYYFRHENNVATNSELEGLDFLEGNLIFKYILDRQKISREALVNALELKLNRFSQIEGKLKNNEIRDKVKKSLLELHPLMKNAWRKYNIDRSVRSFLFRFKRLIFNN